MQSKIAFLEVRVSTEKSFALIASSAEPAMPLINKAMRSREIPRDNKAFRKKRLFTIGYPGNSVHDVLYMSYQGTGESAGLFGSEDGSEAKRRNR